MISVFSLSPCRRNNPCHGLRVIRQDDFLTLLHLFNQRCQWRRGSFERVCFHAPNMGFSPGHDKPAMISRLR